MDEIQRQSHKQQPIRKVKVNNAGATEEVYYSLFYDGVPSEFEKYAAAELNETPQNVAKGQQALKKFLQDKNITDEDDDAAMTFILRNCKYDKKNYVAKFEKFLKTRSMVLERLAAMDIKKVEHIIEDKCFIFLPYRDRLGRATLYTQPSVNFDLYDVDDVFICFFALLMYIIPFPMTSMFGIVQIANCNSSLSLMYRILMVYKNYIRQWLFLPALLKRIFVINENFLIRWFYNVIRPIMPSKIYQRIEFHGSNLEALQELYHPDLLPEECGGNMGPLKTDFYKEELINFIKKLKSEHQRKAAIQN